MTKELFMNIQQKSTAMYISIILIFEIGKNLTKYKENLSKNEKHRLKMNSYIRRKDTVIKIYNHIIIMGDHYDPIMASQRNINMEVLKESPIRSKHFKAFIPHSSIFLLISV